MYVFNIFIYILKDKAFKYYRKYKWFFFLISLQCWITFSPFPLLPSKVHFLRILHSLHLFWHFSEEQKFLLLFQFCCFIFTFLHLCWLLLLVHRWTRMGLFLKIFYSALCVCVCVLFFKLKNIGILAVFSGITFRELTTFW